ncbi:uncharacterized protein LOC134246968 [Saccostrea cucullata]|uniref:uncharacterized protein LOC134246968 n=1 Tax=Saccostrea cuccullata TaxID=36930 RepID=UPI002ED482A4
MATQRLLTYTVIRVILNEVYGDNNKYSSSEYKSEAEQTWTSEHHMGDRSGINRVQPISYSISISCSRCCEVTFLKQTCFTLIFYIYFKIFKEIPRIGNNVLPRVYWRLILIFFLDNTILLIINRLKMFYQHVVVILSVCLCVVTAVPVGLLPPIQNAAPDPGRLAGVIPSTDPSGVYRWLLQLFTQRSFITWLGRTRGVNFQPMVRPFSGGTSDLSLGGTRDPALTARPEDGDPRVSGLNVVRDYIPSASPPQTSTAAQPTVQRDFQANDLIIPQTAEPSKGTGIQIPVLSLKESGGLMGDSPAPSPATLPGDLVIIRDHLKKNTTVESGSVTTKQFHSRLSESLKPMTEEVISTEQKETHTGAQKTTSNNPENLRVERDRESRDLSQSTDQVTIPLNTESQGVSVDNNSVPDLSIQRDRSESTGSNTLPPDLVVIRDSVSDEDSGHIVTTRGVTAPGVAFSTQPVGNGIIILLPSGGKKST